MVYLIGFIGFFCGFALGLMVLNVLLKDRPVNELLESKGLRLRYGLFAWLIAGLSAYAAVWMYKIYGG